MEMTMLVVRADREGSAGCEELSSRALPLLQTRASTKYLFWLPSPPRVYHSIAATMLHLTIVIVRLGIYSTSADCAPENEHQ